MGSDHEQRLRRLEQKVNTLWWLVVAQAVMIGVLAAAYFMPWWPALVVIPLVALLVLVVCRRRLPRWARRCGRFFGGVVFGNPSSSPKGG